MGLVFLIVVILIYTLLGNAAYVPIDDDVPNTRPKGMMPIADFIYRLIRIAAVISVGFRMYGGWAWAIGLYLLAWLFKKICIFIYYYDYL